MISWTFLEVPSAFSDSSSFSVAGSSSTKSGWSGSDSSTVVVSGLSSTESSLSLVFRTPSLSISSPRATAFTRISPDQFTTWLFASDASKSAIASSLARSATVPLAEGLIISGQHCRVRQSPRRQSTESSEGLADFIHHECKFIRLSRCQVNSRLRLNLRRGSSSRLCHLESNVSAVRQAEGYRLLMRKERHNWCPTRPHQYLCVRGHPYLVALTRLLGVHSIVYAIIALGVAREVNSGHQIPFASFHPMLVSAAEPKSCS